MAEETSGYTKGFTRVTPTGPPCPYSADGHGTEAANEGKGSAVPWAKRSTPTPSNGEGY